MPWPQSTDYNLAIQNPHLCFRDEGLRACTPFSADPVLGLPTPRSGNFADVYRLDHPSGEAWAIKCFTREVGDLQERYAAISEHLQQVKRSFIVEFRYLSDAILVDGLWYPIVKMRWIEGKNLSEIVSEHADRPATLDKLARKWLKLAIDLRDSQVGHGDLQHGNVLLVPNAQRGTFSLQLIDYDGMYVPLLADRPSGEGGFPGFQHPQRRHRNLFGPEVDRFAHLVIYTALQAVRCGGSALWNRFGSPENLLFSECDIQAPAQSELLRTLFALPDANLRHLLGHLVLAALGNAEDVPLLETIAPGGLVRRLDVVEFERLRKVLGNILAPPRRTRVDSNVPPAGGGDIPPLPSPLRNTAIDLPPLPTPPVSAPPSPIPPVPTATRLDGSSSLPDWMLPEAVPLEDTVLFNSPQDDSDPETPPLMVPPLVLVPLEPTDRNPTPSIPQFRAVLLEDLEASDTPVALPDPEPPEVAEEEPPPDVVEVVPDDAPLDVNGPPKETSPVPPARGTSIPARGTPRPRSRKKAGTNFFQDLLLLGLFLVLIAGVLAVVLYPRFRSAFPTGASLLRVPDEFDLEAGQEQTLTVHFTPPAGDRGPFEVRLVDLPPPLSGRPKQDQAGEDHDSVAFTLSAPLSAPDSTVTIRLQLVRKSGDAVLGESSVRVRIRRADLPQLTRPLASRRVEVGGRSRLTFDVDLRGYDENLYLRLVDLPRGIVQDTAEPRGGSAQHSLNLNVPRTQEIASRVTQVVLKMKLKDGSSDIEVDRALVVLDFVEPLPSRPFLRVVEGDVAIEPGNQATLRVRIDRSLFNRSLRLHVRNLPEGVSTVDINVPTSNVDGVLLLRATPQAPITGAVQAEILAFDGVDEVGRLATTVRVAPARP